jgi:hypothetical protein
MSTMSQHQRARFRWVIHPVHGESLALSVPYSEDFIGRIKRAVPAWQRAWSKDERAWIFDPSARRAVFAIAGASFALYWNSSIAPGCGPAPPRVEDDARPGWAERLRREAAFRRQIEQRARKEEAARRAAEAKMARRLRADNARRLAEIASTKARLAREAEARLRDEERRAAARAAREAEARLRDEARRAAAEGASRRQAEEREDRERRSSDVRIDFFSRTGANEEDFRALRISPSASYAAAKTAYRAAVARHHTDRGGRLEDAQIVNVAWQRIERQFRGARA